ncbi:MAG: hypothetical protein ACD_15C00062G0001, partial [uncultured bacterium]
FMGMLQLWVECRVLALTKADFYATITSHNDIGSFLAKDSTLKLKILHNFVRQHTGRIDMFSGEWVVYMVMSLVCFGGVNVMDTFFIKEEIYEDVYEIIIVSSLFKAIGIILVGSIFFAEALALSWNVILFSMLGGALLSLSFLFCGIALFEYNDMSLIHVFWGLSTPVTTVMAWFFFEENLGMMSYIGIGVIVFGATLMKFSKKSLQCGLEKFFLLLMVPLIVFYSLSEVVMKHVEEGMGADFWATFAWVCAGQVVFGLLIMIVRYKKIRDAKLLRRIAQAENRNLFCISEIFELAGVFFMMFAIAESPSVSYYAVAESFMPIIVVILTGATGVIMNFLGKSQSVAEVFRENHLPGVGMTILASFVMAGGVCLMYSSVSEIIELANAFWQLESGLVKKVLCIDGIARLVELL